MNAKRLTLVLVLVVALILAFGSYTLAALPVDDTHEAAVELVQTDPTEEPTEEAAADDRAPVNIYAVSHGACAWDSYWCVVEKGSDDAARDLNVDVTLLTTDKFDLEATAQNIDRAVAANPDVLMVTITDAVLFDEPIRRAIDAGIPVIAYDSVDTRPKEERIPYITYVGPDDYQGGYQAGDRFIAAGGATKAVCVNQQVGHVLLDLRCQGLSDRLAEDGIETEVLGVSDDPAQSTTTLSDFYAANPDVDMFLTLGPNSADPFYAFMEAEGLEPGDVLHGTFDLSPKIVEKIKDGTSLFAIDGQPYMVGYLPVFWGAMIHRYGISPSTDITATGPGFVDESNIAVVEELAGTYR
ncbi:MAG: sugar ABC transporter substrate-binding protein [Anaerolineae bacterium]|nr:sugar ABC transporter substrate-binding protein [Anaerolineae bacterium]